MYKTLPLSLLLLLGCDPFEKGLPSELPSVSPLFACVEPADGLPAGWEWEQLASLRGTVSAVGRGATEACGASSSAMAAGDVPRTDLSFIVLDDVASGRSWEVAVSLSNFEMPFEEGEEALVEWRYTPPEWSSGSGALALSDWESAPVLWMAQENSIDRIVAPSGVFLSRGEAIAQVDDGCGVYEGYDLAVSTTDAEGTVPYGEAEMVGGLIVHNGGLVETVEDTTNCLDWWAGGATVAIAW